MSADLDYDARQRVVAAEMAEWPARYAVVRHLTGLGFVASAYGRPGDEPPYLCPPTKFGYPPGGLRYPHHASGPSAGAAFQVWAFNREAVSPDDLAAQPVWQSGDPNVPSLAGYHTRWGLTLEAAVALCLTMAAHHREHFIVPDWINGCPQLPTEQWEEVLALVTNRPPPTGQLALFAAPSCDPDERFAAALVEKLAERPLGGDFLRLLDPRLNYDAQRLIEWANWERHRRGVPDLPAAAAAAAKRLSTPGGPRTMDSSLERTMPATGTVGEVKGYTVMIRGDRVQVAHEANGRTWDQRVPNVGTSVGELMTRPGAALGWAVMPDDAEVLYFYDKQDGNFGYGLNLDCDWCSEWGTAPFDREDPS